MKVKILKKLIKEAIADRIKMIDEAGDIAAIEAKINKVEEDIQDAIDVKSSLVSMAGLKYYVSPEIVSDMMDDMEVSIKELQTKKKDLEDQKKAMAKNTKGPKKSEKKEDKEDLNEEVSVTKEQISKKYNEMMGKNPSTTFADVAKALGVTENQIAMALGMGSIGGLKLESKKPSVGITKKVQPALAKKAKTTKNK